MLFGNRDSFHGEFVDGKPNGFGTFCFKRSGDKYTGSVEMGKIQGRGVMYYSDGRKLEGEWNGDLLLKGLRHHKEGALQMDDVIELEGIVQKAKEEILKVVMEEEGKELKGIELNEASSSSSSTDQKII